MELWSSNIIQVFFLNLSQRFVWKNDGWTAFEILFSKVFFLLSLCNILSYSQNKSLSSSCVLSILFSKSFRFSSALRCSVYFDQQQGSIDFSSSPQYVNSSSNNWPQISDGACNFPITMKKKHKVTVHNNINPIMPGVYKMVKYTLNTFVNVCLTMFLTLDIIELLLLIQKRFNINEKFTLKACRVVYY